MKERLKALVDDIDRKMVIVTTFLISFTLCLVPSLELYFGNKQEFWFRVTDFVLYIFIAFLMTFFVFIGLGFIIKGRVKTIFWCVLFGIGFALYLQANFLNGDMGLMNGQAKDWYGDKIQLYINSICWCLCVLISILLGMFIKRTWSNIVLFLSVMLVAMQLSAVVSLAVTVPDKVQDVCLKTDGMFSLSSDENIVVFVLDTFDAQYFEQYIRDDLKYQELLNDYTYFENAVAGGGPTKYGLPLLMTGQYYNGDVYEEYLAAAYKKANLYDKMKLKGWDTRLYTTDSVIVDDFYKEYINNADILTWKCETPISLAAKVVQAGWYKYFPNIAKNKFFYSSEEFDWFRSATKSGEEKVGIYNMGDDLTFIKQFRENGLSLSSDKPAYRFYHLFGAHGPYRLNNQGENVGYETSLKEQLDAVWNMINEYCEQMKEMGVYDKSTVLIVADHGAYDIYQNPCVLIKEKNVQKDELTVSDSPITFQNILPTISEAVDGINNEDDKTVFEVEKTDNKLRFQVVAEALAEQFYGEGKWDRPLLFAIEGDARDSENFTNLGEIGVVRNIVPYRFGSQMSFAKGKEGVQYLFNGFSEAEDDGCWTSDVNAIQKIVFEKVPQNNLKVQINLQDVFNGKQHVTIEFNDRCVYSQYQTTKEISFIVPKEALVEGEQIIKYRLTTTRPSDISNNTDARDLSIKIKDMIITETNEQDQHVGLDIEYRLGEKIVFTEEDDGAKYFVRGISKAENESVWSLGNEVEFEARLENDSGDITGRIFLDDVYAKPQRVVIVYEDRGENDYVSIGDFSMKLTKTPKNHNVLWQGIVDSFEKPITFDIPKNAIKNDFLNFVIQLPDAVSPSENGEGEDLRKLSLKFKSIEFK